MCLLKITLKQRKLGMEKIARARYTLLVSILATLVLAEKKNPLDGRGLIVLFHV